MKRVLVRFEIQIFNNCKCFPGGAIPQLNSSGPRFEHGKKFVNALHANII